jgi:hypothetical protein
LTRSPSKVEAIISGSMSFPGLGAKIKEYKVRKVWADTVGTAISRKAVPDRLIGKTLYCKVSTAPWMTELSYQKGVIMEGLNSRLGSIVITEIIFKHGHVPEPISPAKPTAAKARELTSEDKNFIDETVSNVKDLELRAAIKRALLKAKS